MEKSILVSGNPERGFSYIGPFETHDVAARYARRVYGPTDWWVCKIHSPEGTVETPKVQPVEPPKIDASNDPKKVAWKVKEWAELVSISKSYVHKLIVRNEIKSIRIGHTRLIMTSPSEFMVERR